MFLFSKWKVYVCLFWIAIASTHLRKFIGFSSKAGRGHVKNGCNDGTKCFYYYQLNQSTQKREKNWQTNANKDYGNDCLTNHIVDCDFKQTKTTIQQKKIMNKFLFLVFLSLLFLSICLSFFFLVCCRTETWSECEWLAILSERIEIHTHT